MRKLVSAALIAALTFSSGCIAVSTPAIGVLYTDVAWPAEATSNDLGSKSGSATAKSFFGLFAHGDVSVETLAKNAGITKVSHVDVKTENILGFGMLTVTVYGD